MITRVVEGLIGRSCRDTSADVGLTRMRSVSRPRRLSGRWWALVAVVVFSGCAAAPAPVVEDDIEAFTLGIDEILKIGMTMKEARAALRERMPRASINTEATAPVPSADRSHRMRRYMVGWPTLNRGTTFVVTIFCDRDRKIVRWTTGPLTENR